MTVDAVRQRSTGAYYTPADTAAFMASWVVAGGPDLVLEPSFGDGVFIRALREAALAAGTTVRVAAVEKDPVAFASFGAWRPGDVPLAADFHHVRAFGVDAVIGNPPFVRFRHLPGREAQAALAAGEAALGAPVDNAGSTWLTFALHAASFVRVGGRMALVLPADALYVRYARPLWESLAERFGGLRVLRCRERLFSDLLQDVVILLAYRAGGVTDRVGVEVYGTRAAIADRRPALAEDVPIREVIADGKPFTRALLGGRAADLLGRLSGRVCRAGDVVKFNIGYVDGNKGFFHPSAQDVAAFGLSGDSLRPALRSGRYWTSGGPFTSELPASARTCLWLPDPSRLTAGERRYIAAGAGRSVHLSYKTAVRAPWYVVPGVRIPDIVVPTFGSLPKLMVNDGGYVVSNSVMAGFWRSEPRPLHLLGCWYSSMTRLGIELAVHSLGGGVLVMVPRECDATLIPVLPAAPPPETVIRRVRASLTSGDLAGAYTAGDEYLVSHGWPRSDLAEARELADALRSWREGR